MEKIQEKDMRKLRKAPINFLPFAMTIIRRVARAFSMIFKLNINKYVIVSPRISLLFLNNSIRSGREYDIISTR